MLTIEYLCVKINEIKYGGISMKKTCLTAMLCVVFCVCAVFFSLGLTACGEKINEYSVEFVIAADENFTKTVK